jgi:alkylation response protein AidB-like acyl-CoA dehydrogenase
VDVEPQPSLDVTVPMHAVTFSSAEVDAVVDGDRATTMLARLTAVGGLLAAAESVGAASRMLEDARAYAAQRRQFGRTIGSYQALRHLMADMYVRQASAWSTVLYAAAALDDDLPEALQTTAVAKAYVARAAREVAHGALQVFGGVAFTQEHQAHRFLRRIIVREQQFGDAAHHERELGRALADRAGRRVDARAVPTATSASAG